MTVYRGTTHTLLILCIVVAFGATACDKLGLSGKKDETSDDSSSKKKKKKKKSSDDDDDDTSASATATATATAAPPPTPTASTPAAPATPDSGDVKRYPDETPDQGQLAIAKASPAHKEATHASDVILTLQPGSEVTRVAREGTFTLVTWKNKSGDHFGWVENTLAFKDYNRDAGTPSQGIEGFGKTTFDAGPHIDAGKPR